MWGPLLALAFMFAVNPVLLAVIVLMISRPRPVQNLLAYWLGSVIVNFVGLLVPLLVLHFTPALSTFSQDMAAPGQSSAGRFIQFGMGILMLSFAAFLVVRSIRQRARVPAPAGDAPALVPDHDPQSPSPVPDSAPNPIASPFGTPQDGAAEGGSIFRRVLRRLQNAWDSGALWVAFVFGLGGLPPPMLVFIVVTSIVSSGASVGTQFIAVVVFVVAMFSVVEITLVSYLVAPAKTLALLRPLHDWALRHRRQVLITIFTVVGLISVVNGILA
ncbi:GAP family protein [Mycolicibacterium pulveris]|uniref:GAP family protein n=1 Tax=Mycolicibacterium pulveris TaxID=36813 RepID=UPI003CF16776